MPKFISRLAFLLVFSICNQALAFATQYTILIDAGSTSSRLHLYEYTVNNKKISLKEILSKGNESGLATYADNPQAAGLSLKPIIDAAVLTLQNQEVALNEVPISVLATAGMRLLPLASQAQIYTNVQSYIHQHYPLKIKKITTISGQEEALYGWLAVNYLLNNFNGTAKTVGSLDLGGASTEIAFAVNENTKTNDVINVTVNSKTYHVFSKSFLGLGLNSALETITENKNASVCYPSHYPLNTESTGHFDFETCGNLYGDLIAQYHIPEILPSTQGQYFIAYSGAYFVNQFFGGAENIEHYQFEENVKYRCSETWEQLQNENPGNKYVSRECAFGEHVDKLFFETYKLNAPQITITNKINNTAIEWTIGTLLWDAQELPQ